MDHFLDMIRMTPNVDLKAKVRMRSFKTPEPISVHVELGVGTIRLEASERSETIVVVRPTNPQSKADVLAAERTRVEYEGGRLTVKAAKGWRYYTSWAGARESIDVEIALPSGSRFEGEAGLSTLRCTGRLNDLRFKTSAGDIHVEQTGPLMIHTGMGNVNVDRAEGPAMISTGTGRLEIGEVDGSATVRNSNGDTWIGDVAGELLVSAANGKIAVDRSQSAVTVKSANGDIVLGAVASGDVVAKTACGRVNIGVANGVPAWLELHTGRGSVRNELKASSEPGPNEESVKILARTGYGDITIHRALDARAAAELTA